MDLASVMEQGRRASVATQARIAELVEEINHDLGEFNDAKEAALMRAVRIGKALSEAKRLLDRGDYLPWIERHFEFSRAWAATCVRAADAYDLWSRQNDGDLSMELPEVKSIEHLAGMLPTLKRGDDPLEIKPKARKLKVTPAEVAFKAEGAEAEIQQLREVKAAMLLELEDLRDTLRKLMDHATTNEGRLSMCARMGPEIPFLSPDDHAFIESVRADYTARKSLDERMKQLDEREARIAAREAELGLT